MTTALAKTQSLPATADAQGLRTFGFVFGAVTAAVVLVACAVVHANADGRLARADAGYDTVGASSRSLGR
jgi:hypothetical protein